MEDNEIVFTNTKYFEDGESAFMSPFLDVVGSNLYYADARLGHPLSFGGYDVLVGYFNVELNNICLIAVSYTHLTLPTKRIV